MSDRPGTSIVIPTHNRAAMVPEAVESALSQPGSEGREVLVVDDGSTDNTQAVLASFRERIRVLSVSHGERSRARNAGMEAARGRFVLFLDDDDVLLPGVLPRLEAELASAPADVAMVYGRPRYVKLDPTNPVLEGELQGNGASGWIFAELLAGNFLQPGAILVRPELLLSIGGFDPAWPPLEDYELWLRAAARWRILYVDEEIAAIRLHETNSLRRTEGVGKLTERVKESRLLSDDPFLFAARAGPGARSRMARLALELALRRWWEGKVGISRRAHRQALRLSPLVGLSRMDELWRIYLPRRSSPIP